MSNAQIQDPLQNPPRIDVLIQSYHTHSSDDDHYLRLLHQVFEFIEQLTLNGGPEDQMPQLLEVLLPLLLERVSQTEIQFVGNVKHKIRRQTLEILSMIPFPNEKSQLPLNRINEFLLLVIERDNEENSELAIKMLYEMQRFYRNTFFVLNEVPRGVERFFEALFSIIQNLSEILQDTKMTADQLTAKRMQQIYRISNEEAVKSMANNPQKLITPSLMSMKTMNHFTNFYLWTINMFPEVVGNYLGQTFSVIFKVLGGFPEDIFKQVKNLRLYLDLLETLRNLMNFLNFIFKRTTRGSQTFIIDVFVEKFPVLFTSQFLILKNLPHVGTVQIRKDILNHMKQALQDISNFEKNDLQQARTVPNSSVPRIDKGYYQNKKQTLKGLTEELIGSSVLTGKGKPYKEHYQHARQIQQTFIQSTKEYMTLPQLKLAMSITQASLLDNNMSLTLRSSFIVNVYKLYDEFKKKGLDTIQELYDLLELLTCFYKDLDQNFQVVVNEYAALKADLPKIKSASRTKWMNDMEQKSADIRDLLLADSAAQIVDMSKDRTQSATVDFSKFQDEYQFYFLHDYVFESAASDVTRQKDFKYFWLQQMDEKQIHEYMDQMKDNNVFRLTKNLISFNETMLNQITEKQDGNNFLQYREMNNLRKILIHGSNIIQHYSDLVMTNATQTQPAQFSNPQDKDKLFELVKKFSKIFLQIQPLQFRDLITSTEDEFLGRMIEIKATKGDVGIVFLVDMMMSFVPPNPPGQPVNSLSYLMRLDEYPSYLLEIFFSYIVKKMKLFNKPMENEKLLSTNKLDQRLAQIPTSELQDTIQKLALMIGEKALSKKNDQRMKNLFFSVFIFCIKFTKASKIVPYYFQVIRNLFKLLSSLNDNNTFVKEFVPMIQGLLETFLQAKEEAAFIKETNEICYSVPAKLKSLIEYLPITSRPLIDSMKQNQFEVIESGITTIQMWVSALTSYPEILDPIIESILPELNSLLYKIFCVLPHSTFKLLGKFGAKTRLYFEDKEFRAKNFPEEGLKISLEDKSTGREVVLPLDSAIGAILIKVFDCFQKYNQEKLLQAYKLVKNSFLCYVEPDHDLDYLVLSIVNAKNQCSDHLIQYAKNSAKYFDSKKTQTRLSNMSRGAETHGFEKILKSLLIASSIPKNNPETELIHSKVKKFFKWVTQYFTLIYISKNDKLKENLQNEISPLSFFDNVCEFLYFNVLQNSPKVQQRSYLKGSIRAIKIMIRTVKQIYGPGEQEINEAFEKLEFVQLLIQKVCHIAYGQDQPNKVAMNIALQIIIKELPQQTIKNNAFTFLDALFHILNISHEQLVHQVEVECKNTLNMFFEKVGTYTPSILANNRNDSDFQNQLLDKVINNFYSNKTPARTLAMHFIDKIARTSHLSVLQLLSQLQRPQREQQQASMLPVQGDRSWSFYLVSNYIEGKSKQLFQQYKGGYTQVLNLVAYLDLFQYLLQHKVIQPLTKVHVYLVVCEQLLKILEEEVSKYDQQNEQQQQPPAPPMVVHPDQNISLASKSAHKYMKLEKQYISQNKVYDPYSHTLHPHHFMQNQHFEVEEQAKRDKLQQEFDSVQYSYNQYEMFVQRMVPGQPVQVEFNPKFTETLSIEEQDKCMKNLNTRINEFIKKLFVNSIKASDISFEYIHHMYELYPNHRLHAELIAKSLQVLCDIATEDNMHAYFKVRQQVYFDQMQSYQIQQTQMQEQVLIEFYPQIAQMQGPSKQQQLSQQLSLLTNEQHQVLEQRINNVPIFAEGGQLRQHEQVCKKQDLYSVEIKSKIIAMFFKFFQREEQIVFKMAKKCLSRILQKEVNQQEALPNLILKECVRPSLNIISMRTSTPALYEQLTRLICVLHGCFNEQLGKHLIRCYESSKPKFNEDFKLYMTILKQNPPSETPQGGDPSNAQAPVASEPNPRPSASATVDAMSDPDRIRHFQEDYDRLIQQQNQRIEEIENAYHITKILYLLLPQNRQEIHRILMHVPEFENQILVDLEKKFKDTFRQLFEFYKMSPTYPVNPEQNLRPLAIKLGQLKSDLREGILKFYNKNPFDAVEFLKNQAMRHYNSEEIKKKQGGLIFYDLMIDIVSDPASYCLRERFARETDIIKHFLNEQIESLEFYFALNLVSKLQKFNPSVLTLSTFQQVLYMIRSKWNQLADFDIAQSQNQMQFRRAYKKLMSVYMTYCKLPKAKTNAIIDLVRGYRNYSPIDMSPVRLFILFELPFTLTFERAREIILNLIERIKLIPPNSVHPPSGHIPTMNVYEYNYQCFDMLFMPIIMRYTDSDVMFRELFDEKVLFEFMDAYFGQIQFMQTDGTRQVIMRIDDIKNGLEISTFFSYEQYMVEIAKVLNLIFRYFEYDNIRASCQNDIVRLNNFLYLSAKKSKSPVLVEWSFYSATSMFIRILNSISMDPANKPLLDMMDRTSEQLLLMILQHQQNLTYKALVQKSFRNLLQIMEYIAIHRAQTEGVPMGPNRHEGVANFLKEALIYEGRQSPVTAYLCSFILANSEMIYQYDYKFKFIIRINKIISRLTANNTISLAQKQLVIELCQTLIKWAKDRFIDYQRKVPGSQEIIQTYYSISFSMFYNLSRLAINIQSSPYEPQKDNLELIQICIKQIRSLLQLFSGAKVQFALFQRIIQDNQNMQGGMEQQENIQLVRLVMLNIFHVLNRYSQQRQETIQFFLEVLLPVETRFQKGILFSSRMIAEILQVGGIQDPEIQRKINEIIKTHIINDVTRVNSVKPEDVLAFVRQIEEKYRTENRPVILCFQEQASAISQIIPHFAIRLVDYLEREQKRLGINYRTTRGFVMIENEFAFLKQLSQIIYKVISLFRKQIIFDQGEASPAKLKFKHLVLHMTNNHATQYTQSDLIALNEDVIEIRVDDTNFDMFNKESILLGMQLLAKRMKKLPNEEAVFLLESFTSSFQYLVKYDMNEYILEGVRKVVDILIEDDPEDVTRMLPEKKAEFIRYMLSKIPEINQSGDRKEGVKESTQLVEKIFEQGIRFLEIQGSLMHEYSVRIFEKLFIHSKGKPVALKHRLFDVFERSLGTSLFKKLNFFFAKHVIDESDKIDKLSFYAAQSQFLDFTLYGFRTKAKSLTKIKGSSKLFSFSSGEELRIENMNIKEEGGGDVEMQQEEGGENNEYRRIVKAVEEFSTTYKRVKGKKMSSLMNCLSEIISLNPNYSSEKQISDKLLTSLFHQYWSLLLTREEQQVLTDSLSKYLMTSVNLIGALPSQQQANPNLPQTANDFKRFSFPRVILESLASFSPQVRLEPELLQLLAKTFNLWHVALPILENHAVLQPDNERYFFAMSELYDRLSENDYIAGLRRVATKSPEMRSMIAYSQHDMWEEVNQQFSQFLIYYAEQEGQYAQMDEEQKRIGKYQRQLPEQSFMQLVSVQQSYCGQQYDTSKERNPDQPPPVSKEDYVKQKREELEMEIDRVSGRRKFMANPDVYSYPRKGPNNYIKEIDLRVWETLFTDSLKVLNKWDQYYDIARALTYNVDINNVEMHIEYAWASKNWQMLNQYESLLRRSDSIKHRIYHIYLSIKSQHIQMFDDAFKTVVQIAYNRWDMQLPKYVDSVHFDNLILYQLIMEGSEGGRNMVKEAQTARNRGRLVELKTAVNIWRERLPHKCESIQIWKEVLENRNFIQDQIGAIMIPTPRMQPPPEGTSEQQVRFMQQQHENTINAQRQRFTNEFLDKTWNYYQLAQVSRKQGLPLLAIYYLNQLEGQLKFSFNSETTKFERFKFDYEQVKLQLEYNTNAESLGRFINTITQKVESEYDRPAIQSQIMPTEIDPQSQQQQRPPLVFEPQQTGALKRLIGEYFYKVGSLDKAQKYLKESLALNKKESKTWLSYAKLNQTVFSIKKDEVSLQLMIKSYLSAITLALHKSRFIIPQFLNLIKRRATLNAPEYREVTQALRKNLDQMPTWIWIFWIPQILHMLFQANNQIEANFCNKVLEKLSKLYPQAIYYSLKARHEMARIGLKTNMTPEETQTINQQNLLVNSLTNQIRRVAYHSTINLDRISTELQKTLKCSPEEELLVVLNKILCMSQFFKIDHFDRDFNSFLTQLHQRFFNSQNTQISPLLSELQSIYERDFLIAETREMDIIEIIKRVKNLKHYLHKRISLSETKNHLELISPFLANFNDKGVELPGQFMISELEPLPQNTIYIQKFDPYIQKGSSLGTKRILIKCSNQRQYSFVVTNLIQSKEEYGKVFNDERLNQVKLLMNQIFKKHKDTLKRGAKFYVPIKAMMLRCKIVQDDQHFQTMQEIHDFLFQERGMDTDQALSLQIKKVEETLKSMVLQEGQERTISSISDERKQEINDETFQEMQNIYCKPYLLSSFFHRIFYNVDELFLFKKYFTTYHAVNSFFAYVFHQVDFFTLSQLSVSKTSGFLSFNDAKLIEFLKNRNVKRYITQAQQQTVDFESLEQEDMQAQSYLPFRLSNNFVEFIGRTGGGLHGVFAGVMTACSLAITKHHEKLMPLLQLVYRDDLNDDRENAIFFITQCTEYMKYKMLSLSKNRQVLNLDQYLSDPEYVKQYQKHCENQQRGGNGNNPVDGEGSSHQYVHFGNVKVPAEYLKYEVEKPNTLEEFNKKVFDLIEIAMDEKRLSQMPSNWHAWF